mgnify:CR=1 FL=1
MNKGLTDNIRERVDSVYRDESRRVFATLIQLLVDFDLADGIRQAERHLRKEIRS